MSLMIPHISTRGLDRVRTSYLEDLILDHDSLEKLDFSNEMMTVTLVEFETKLPLYVPVSPRSHQKAMYVFAMLPQEDVEAVIESIHEDNLALDFIQIWQVTRAQIEEAMATPGVTVYLDLPSTVGRFNHGSFEAD